MYNLVSFQVKAYGLDHIIKVQSNMVASMRDCKTGWALVVNMFTSKDTTISICFLFKICINLRPVMFLQHLPIIDFLLFSLSLQFRAYFSKYDPVSGVEGSLAKHHQLVL